MPGEKKKKRKKKKKNRQAPPIRIGHSAQWVVPVVRGGAVRIGRPQCPMLNGRCLCTGSDAEEVWVQKNVTERQILPFVTANGVLPRVILCCRGWCTEGTQCQLNYNAFGDDIYLTLLRTMAMLMFKMCASIPTPYMFTGRAGTYNKEIRSADYNSFTK